MMTTARMAHINRKRPRVQSTSNSDVAGLPLSLSGNTSAREVIDLDSDSENYIFKDRLQSGKRPKNYAIDDESALIVDGDGNGNRNDDEDDFDDGGVLGNEYNVRADALDDFEDDAYDDQMYDMENPQLYTQQQWFKPRLLSDDDIPSDSCGSTTMSPYGIHQFDGQIVSPRSTSSSSSTTSSNVEPHHQMVVRRVLKRKRTRSVPQLPYTKLCYVPLTDKHSVMEKIGEVETTLIPHRPLTNYTYGDRVRHAEQQRKFSFDYGRQEQALLDHPQLQNNEDEEEEEKGDDDDYDDELHNSSSSSATSMEDTPCDDKDGHYIVNAGAFFANDRFQISQLLGQGTFGKVIKAYDRQNRSTVAIKIIKAIPKYREASKIELRVLAMLKKHDPENVNQCIHLRECFDYRGHICIVTDMLSISLYDFLEKNQFLPFPGSHIQAIARQLLRSVAFLHDLNLIHTDLKPENILLQDDSFVRKSYKKPRSSKVLYRKILRDPKIFTIDFGSAIFDDEYHSSVVSTRHYRAPEIVLGSGWSYACDIWSVGCILVELLTGDALFRTHENVQHLAMMQKVIGSPIDLKLVRKCFSHFYHSDGHRRENRRSSEECIADAFSKSTGALLFPAVTTARKLISEVDQLQYLPDLIGSRVGLKFNWTLNLRESMILFKVPKSKRTEYKFWYFFIDLVRRMLTLDPDQRITAMEAMNHKWFKCGIIDDGLEI
ncbi:hypothetical protein FOA43_004702 [Brettanomyces nanus]|uniref:Protein kinase domain-containing protein n=1 Tax=Eeniella nana TaxID=13502 RepID=A0A875SFC0_EENNA|nr:uncharacterized protein FOA43_004702 [Brettanomyces nanus]QPG77294.1 hypothetical protein FOA43_004702 [Brettanomyces nanus]